MKYILLYHIKGIRIQDMKYLGDIQIEKTDTESDEHNKRDELLKTLRENIQTVESQLEEQNEKRKKETGNNKGESQLEEQNEKRKKETGNNKGEYNKSINYMYRALNKIKKVSVKEFDGEVRHLIASKYIGGALDRLPHDTPRDLKNSMIEIQRQLRLTFDENRSECQGYLQKIYEYNEHDVVHKIIFEYDSNNIEGDYLDELKGKCHREINMLDSLDQSTSTLDELMELKTNLKEARSAFKEGFDDEMESLEKENSSLGKYTEQYKENGHRMHQIHEMSIDIFHLLYLCIGSVDHMIFIKKTPMSSENSHELMKYRDINDDHIAHGSSEPTHETRDSKKEDKGETGDSKTEDKGTPGEAHKVGKSGWWSRVKNGWGNLVRNGKTHEETKKLLMDLKALEMSMDEV